MPITQVVNADGSQRSGVAQQDLSALYANASKANAGLSVNLGSNPNYAGSAPYNNQPAAPANTAANAAAAQAARDSANTSAYYNDQIGNLNNQNGRLDAQQNVGLSNIDNSYNTSLNRLESQKGQAEQNYNIQTQDNTGNYSKNRSAIISKTNNRANALQRLLGIAGSGNSSAAYEQAPYAAGLQGTQDLTEAQGAYSTNARNLGLSRDNFLNTYKNNRSDLDQQRFSQTNNLKSSIASTRAGLLDQIRSASVQRDIAGGKNYAQAAAAQGGTTANINNILNSITDLGRQYANPVVQTGNVNFDVPTLSQYSLGRGATPAVQGGASSVDSTFSPLLNQRRDAYGNILS